MQTSNLAEVCLLQRPCHLVFISGLPFGLDEVRHVEFFSSRMGLDHAVDSRLRGPDESLHHCCVLDRIGAGVAFIFIRKHLIRVILDVHDPL